MEDWYQSNEVWVVLVGTASSVMSLVVGLILALWGQSPRANRAGVCIMWMALPALVLLLVRGLLLSQLPLWTAAVAAVAGAISMPFWPTVSRFARIRLGRLAGCRLCWEIDATKKRDHFLWLQPVPASIRWAHAQIKLPRTPQATVSASVNVCKQAQGGLVAQVLVRSDGRGSFCRWYHDGREPATEDMGSAFSPDQWHSLRIWKTRSGIGFAIDRETREVSDASWPQSGRLAIGAHVTNVDEASVYIRNPLFG